MTRTAAAAAFLLLATACAKSPETVRAEGEAAVRAQLRNPQAATFERVRPCPNTPNGITGAVATPEFADTDGFSTFVYVDGEAVIFHSETSRFGDLMMACTGRRE